MTYFPVQATPDGTPAQGLDDVFPLADDVDGAVDGTDAVVGDPYDDVWDALRYGLYSHHDPEKKPTEMRVHDRLNDILN